MTQSMPNISPSTFPLRAADRGIEANRHVYTTNELSIDIAPRSIAMPADRYSHLRESLDLLTRWMSLERIFEQLLSLPSSPFTFNIGQQSQRSSRRYTLNAPSLAD